MQSPTLSPVENHTDPSNQTLQGWAIRDIAVALTELV